VRMNGTFVHLTTRGFFSKVEAKNHVNWLELKAQHLTRQALLPRAVPREKWGLTHISHLSDNTSAVKYANVNVSRSLSLSRLGACYPLTPLLYNLEPSTFISRLNSVSARYF
jgi:hypothetical protein